MDFGTGLCPSIYTQQLLRKGGQHTQSHPCPRPLDYEGIGALTLFVDDVNPAPTSNLCFREYKRA